MTSASDSSRCDDIDEMCIFKIKCMVPDKWLRIAKFYAHGWCIKVVRVFSTWVHHLLVLYQAGRSSSVSSVCFGGVYLHLRVSCVSLLPPAACSNSSSSGGADVYPLDSHLRPGVAPAGAAEDRQRNVRPVCGGGERHLPQQKRYVPFPPFWVAGLIGSVCLDPGRFLLRQ